jgi:hypothetical protein
MKCDKCSQAARVHVTEVKDSQKIERHLCGECASTEMAVGGVLRLKVCPLCDYWLVGSPAVGICPECGRKYDTNGIYLYGNALGGRRNSWNSPLRGPKRIILSGIITVAIVLFYLGPGRFAGLHGLHDPISVFIAGWFVAMYLLSLWRGLSDQGSGVVQVKLAAAGVRQGTRGLGPLPYEANEKGKLVAWRKVKEVQFGWRESYGEIRLSNQRGFWKLNLYREYVNANFACSKDEFIEVRMRVREWLVENDCAAALQYMANDSRSAMLPGGAMNEIA